MLLLQWAGEWSTKPKRSWDLRSDGLALLGFELVWDLSPLSSFWFIPFEMGMSIPCLSDYCILVAVNSFGFIGSQMERNIAPGWIISQISPISDLDEILDLELMLEWINIGWGGNVGQGWMHFACEKDMNLVGLGRRADCYGLNCILSKIHWIPNPQYLRMWIRDRASTEIIKLKLGQ